MLPTCTATLHFHEGLACPLGIGLEVLLRLLVTLALGILRKIAERVGLAHLIVGDESFQILDLLLTQVFYCVSVGLRVVRCITSFVLDVGRATFSCGCQTRLSHPW